jgi:hypothetical protein
MIELFFGEAHDTIRNACTLSFKEILDNCFYEKTYGKDEIKQAKDLIYAPLFEELKPKKFIPGKDAAIASLTTRQSACYVIRRLNEMHMNPQLDPAVMDASHCLNQTDLGIKIKLYDANFLDSISDMLEHE